MKKILIVILTFSIFLSGCSQVKESHNTESEIPKEIEADAKNSPKGQFVEDSVFFNGVFNPKHYQQVLDIGNDKKIEILIYDYNDLNDFQTVSGFKKVLSTKKVVPGMTFPYENAAATNASQEKYVSNDKGEFHRYIAYFSQEISEPDLDFFTYILQGFTKDGKYVRATAHDLSVSKKDGAFAPDIDLDSLDQKVFNSL